MTIPLSFLANIPSPPPELSLGEHIAEAIERSGSVATLLDCLCTTDAPALWSPEADACRPPLTHAALRNFVSEFTIPTSGLHDRLVPNDRVMIVLPTGPENAVALLAVSAYHTCAPVNAACTLEELARDATRLRAKVILATPEVVDRLELWRLRDELRCEIVYLHARSEGPAGLFDLSALQDDDDDLVVVPRSTSLPTRLNTFQDQALVLHTSGTSGMKKVVPYTLRSLVVGTCAVTHSWNLQPSDINMNMMPLFHVGGIVRNLWAPVFSGGSAIMCSGFDSTTFWPIVQALGATWYYASPTMHHAILLSKPDSVTPFRDTRIRMVANAAGGLLPSLACRLRDTFGATILPSYGMTECMPIASPPITYKLDRPGCSGVACGPHLSIRTPITLDHELSRACIGAVCVKGLPMFDGYETTPGAPLDRSAFSSEGWFDSGDVGYMDDDGYLYITGRSKEIINKGGEVVSPFEIEEAIMSVAAHRVKESMSFSVPHDVLQETVGVAIVPSDNSLRIGLAELLDLVKTKLHPSKWPFAVVYVDNLPKNSAGKPLRIKFAERLGLGTLTDDTPPLLRHFEASVLDPNAPLSQSIPCTPVSVDVTDIEKIIKDITGIREVAARIGRSGSPEALVSLCPTASLDSASITCTLASLVSGYANPSPLHVFYEPLATAQDGSVDWETMEAKTAHQAASSMSPAALVIRNIVAELLDKDPAPLTGDSDFFLLGGNSLLLGRLAHCIRKRTGVTVRVSSVFLHSTINGIASRVEADATSILGTPDSSTLASTSAEKSADSTKSSDLPLVDDNSKDHRGQCHPLALAVQAMPLLLLWPLRATLVWTAFLFILANNPGAFSDNSLGRLGATITSALGARLAVNIFPPLAAIVLKWLIIGRYKPGLYRFWSNYHLRWWITDQALRIAGPGVFSAHPWLTVLYYRMLGARIGKNVNIHPTARLAEFDLLTLHSGCRLDNAQVRGFSVERGGYFRLGPVVVGHGASINTYTVVAPGAVVPDGATYGPHASSHDPPSPEGHAQYNRAAIPGPHWSLKLFVAMPILLLVTIVAYLPWIAALYLHVSLGTPTGPGSSLERQIILLSTSNRVALHALTRITRALFRDIFQVVAGIAIKRAMGLNREGAAADASQWARLRRYINNLTLSQDALQGTFDIIGSHYELTSVLWRCMGAKIGKRVYWPGSSFYCPDPELLEVGDDVVFGSRSEVFTTDGLGSGRVVIKAGAMIADRVVLLPGTTVGRRAVMGSGALGRRGATYTNDSVWMGSEGGEALCLKVGGKDAADDDVPTITPFGRAYYERKAPYFVFPYPFILLINVTVAVLGATYWSLAPVLGVRVLNLFRTRLPHLHLFDNGPRQLPTLVGLFAAWFVLALPAQALLALALAVGAKWLLLGRRAPGALDWDASAYCQRWQAHLALSGALLRGVGGRGGAHALAGSAYAAWLLRAYGARVGRGCAVWAGGRAGLMTEPDLVELGDGVALDECSVVAHINSRGRFALNKLVIGSGSALRAGSRLLSGASMEDGSLLLEHALLASGEIAEAGAVYGGWPARLLDEDPRGRWMPLDTPPGFRRRKGRHRAGVSVDEAGPGM